MMHGMGGGIGATMIMGWPLADWAVIMLLLIVSIMVVAVLTAMLTLFKPRTLWRDRPPTPALPPDQSQPSLRRATHQLGLTEQPINSTINQPEPKGTQDA